MKMHTTIDGKKIKLCDMTDAHLTATIKMFERRAKEGLRIRVGCGSCAEDMWYDEDVLYGDEALEALGYTDYTKELYQRGLDAKSEKMKRILKWMERECKCPCCSKTCVCADGCTFHTDCPHSADRMASAREALYGADTATDKKGVSNE